MPPSPLAGPIELRSVGGPVFTLTDGAGTVTVRAEDPATGTPCAGVPVRFAIVDGSARLPGAGDERVVDTDATGIASTRLEADQPGATFVSVALVDDPSVDVQLLCRTEGVAHELNLYAPPLVAFGEKSVELTIGCVDHRGDLAADAELAVRARCRCQTIDGRIVANANGLRVARLDGLGAGCWAVEVSEARGQVTARTEVLVLAGPPAEIVLIGETDPRAAPPYGGVVARATLRDARGDLLPPLGLRCFVDGVEIAGVPDRDEARFAIAAPASAPVKARFVDEGSGLELVHRFEFHGAWMANPGFVCAGSRYATPVFYTPRPGESFVEGEVELTYDAAQVAPVAIEPAGDVELTVPTPLVAHVDLTDDMVGGERRVIALVRRAGPPREDVANGIHLCTPIWDCRQVGKAWFSVMARMSPETTPHLLCVNQKQDQPVPFCVHVVHRRQAGRAEAVVEALEAFFRDTAVLERCCPAVALNAKIVEWSDDQVRQLRRTVERANARARHQSSTIRDLGGFDDFISRAQSLLPEERCLNIFLWNMHLDSPGRDDTAAFGRASGIGGDARACVLDIEASGRRRMAPHEVCHVLGLSHVDDARNLMYPHLRDGRPVLDPAQCETIVGGVARFPGPP